MKSIVADILETALAQLPELAEAAAGLPVESTLERTRDVSHGDFASNIAMRLAKPARMSPRDIAARLIEHMADSNDLDKVEIAGPGFINFHLGDGAYHAELGTILEQGDGYGRQPRREHPKVLLEFVSANPTGPLHVGHGRHAAYGATVGNLLEAAGYPVAREYYVNDAGRQMDILGLSVYLRWLEALGRSFDFPDGGYRGDYIRGIAGEIEAEGVAVLDDLLDDLPASDKDEVVDELIDRAKRGLGRDTFAEIRQQALDSIRADIEEDLAEFGVTFDRWFSEQSLTTEGRIDAALDVLEKSGKVYEKDGAKWFRATDFGDEKDRVVVRAKGGGLEAMGYSAEDLEVKLMQFVALFRGGEKVQMSTRSGEFETLRQLREEVGNDAARFFYVSRGHDQHLDFDLDVAKSESNDNPVYYIQYAHARIASVFRQLAERSLEWDAGNGHANLQQLREPQEKALMTTLSRYPEVIDLAAANRAPQHLVHYLRDLANDFHTYYNALAFIVDDTAVRDARLVLISATRVVVANGLAILGVSAPETM
jgi:arginyl-tRNA synthetase